MKIVNVVAAIILDTNTNKILATQRGYGEFKDGWEFPGGKVEEGETPENALIREIEEELQARIKVDKYLTTVEYDYPTFHLSMKCYMCRLDDGEELVLTDAHENKLWLDKEHLYDVSWLPADIGIIPLIEKELETK